MSTETNSGANAQGTEAQGKGIESEAAGTQLSMDTLMKRVVELEETRSRLLEESKKGKVAYQKLKEEVEAKQAKALEEQGQWKPLYEKSEADKKTLKEALVREKVLSKVEKEATRYGVVDIEALFALGNTDLIKYDEETETVQGHELFLEDAKKRKPYLFNAAKPTTVNTSIPGGMPVERKLTFSQLGKLKQDEKNKLWASALQKTKK